MKKLVYTISFVLIAFGAIAQDMRDALRYSNYQISGTARSSAMGNAFGSLGGDFSSLSINPAGVAVYRSGEFTFTPSFGNLKIDGTYHGNSTSDSKYNIGINNIGYVASIPTGENSESGLVSLSFGIGFNRLGSFSMSSIAEASNAEQQSILKYFTDNMNANHGTYYGNEANTLDPNYEKLAWDTYLINHDDQNNEYYNDITDYGYKQSQQKTIERKGYINEYLLSFGANFNHKLYLGATLGIHDVYFKENTNLYEWYPNNDNPYFEHLNYGTNLKTTGNGFNFKIGAIFKPIESLRLGIAFHTPTFYKLSDNYYNTMESYNANDNGIMGDHFAKPDQNTVYDYQINTPLKTIFSGSYIIEKTAIISVDYEIVDFSSAKLVSVYNGDNFTNENRDIKNAYRSVGNLHLGGELRVNRNFSLRAGYENYPSVYKSTYMNQSNMNSNSSYSTVSGGFGYKQGNFFFDAAIKHATNKEYSKLYPDAPDMAKYASNQNNVIMTFGYKF